MRRWRQYTFAKTTMIDNGKSQKKKRVLVIVVVENMLLSRVFVITPIEAKARVWRGSGLEPYLF